MVNRTTKLKWRRRVRRGRRQVENIGEQAEQHLEQHVITRLGRLWEVRRFLLAWLALGTMLIAALIAQTRALSPYYQTLQPIPGGTYTEGILGSFTNANPLYATGPVDGSVARLVFAGLFKYSPSNTLAGDLAQRWQVNDRGTVYTVTLRDNLRWHDGHALTAADIVFTYTTIQNPDAKSPLFSSWQGVKVTALDARTVTFTLPQALSSFPYAMTNGIVPQHLLSGIPPSQLRSVAFNTGQPIGAGPFQWKTIEVVGSTPETREERIALAPFANYAGGRPKLDGFVVRAFHDSKALGDSLARQELTAAAGLDRIPDKLAKKQDSLRTYSFPLTSATMVFLKNTSDVLADAKVRQALVLGTDTRAIIKQLGYAVHVVDEPLLSSQLGYDPKLAQLSFDPAAAAKLLDDAGWKQDPKGIRQRDGRPLAFRLFTENTPEYVTVTDQLKLQWQKLGVQAEFMLLSAGDLQATIAIHGYDALLYGISMGVDPDVFAYWHSTQGDIRSPNRLNFSEYHSAVADRALEAGRTRDEAALRAIKYRPFLEAWRNDAPAIGLYQPRFLYLTHTTVAGLQEHPINTGIDRYANVANWMIRETQVDNP